MLARVLMYMLFAQAILSWFVNPYTNPNTFFAKAYMILGRITQPIVKPVRKFMSRFNTGMMDFSVLITMLLIMALQRIIHQLYFMLL
jgi:YggT family protein